MSILKQPITVGGIQLKNRLVMPPMATEKAENGLVNESHINYYGEKSRGGHIGLIITEHMYVSIEGKAGKGQLSAADDGCISGLAAIAKTVHDNGSKIFAQISHAGGAANKRVTGHTPISASRMLMPRKQNSYDLPRRMTKEDINRVVRRFADAAARVQKAGYDGVEIHAAHGYLLNQFFSPLTNNRQDEYGRQSVNSRIKMLLETVAAVKQATGGSFPVAVRLGACDYARGGTTVQHSVDAGRLLEQAGVCLLDISGGFCSYRRPGHTEPGYFSELSGPVKWAVNIPVILTGGVQSARQAEQLLEDGKADLIGVGRAILTDSRWAANAMAQPD